MTRAQIVEDPVVTGSDGKRLRRRFVLEDPFGFHARPAALFVKTAQRYDADITVSNRSGVTANGKSIMGLLTLMIQHGEELVVTAQGSDAADALVSIGELVFGALARQRPDTAVLQDVEKAALPVLAPRGTACAYAHANR